MLKYLRCALGIQLDMFVVSWTHEFFSSSHRNLTNQKLGSGMRKTVGFRNQSEKWPHHRFHKSWFIGGTIQKRFMFDVENMSVCAETNKFSWLIKSTTINEDCIQYSIISCDFTKHECGYNYLTINRIDELACNSDCIREHGCTPVVSATTHVVC
jgi:hypothetical protein